MSQDLTLKPLPQTVGMHFCSYVYAVVVSGIAESCINDEEIVAALAKIKNAKANLVDGIWVVICKFREEYESYELHLEMAANADGYNLKRIQIYGDQGTKGPLLEQIRFNEANQAIYETEEEVPKAA